MICRIFVIKKDICFAFIIRGGIRNVKENWLNAACKKVKLGYKTGKSVCNRP